MSQAAQPYARARESADESIPSPPAPPTAHVIAMSDLDGPRASEAAHGNGANGVQRLASPLASALGDLQGALRNVKAKLTVCVGSAELTVGELLGAQEQQVIRLDRSVEQPVDVLLEGHVVARGTLVAVGERFAVRITEVPEALGGGAVSSRKG
jgi:flagellar motor switch protein FliN/FliY